MGYITEDQLQDAPMEAQEIQPSQIRTVSDGTQPSLWDWTSGIAKGPIVGGLRQLAAIPQSSAIAQRQEDYDTIRGEKIGLNEGVGTVQDSFTLPNFNPNLALLGGDLEQKDTPEYKLQVKTQVPIEPVKQVGGVPGMVGFRTPALSTPAQVAEAKQNITVPLERTGAYRLGQGIMDMAPDIHPTVRQSYPYQIGEVFGQAAVQSTPMVAQWLMTPGLTSLASTGKAGLSVANGVMRFLATTNGPVGSYIASGSAETADMYQRARQLGANEEVAAEAATEATKLGIYDVIGTAGLLGFIGKVGGATAPQKFISRMQQIATKYPRTIAGLAGAAEEASTEIPQSLQEDEIAKKYFNEKVDEWSTAIDSGVVAGGSGFILAVLIRALGLRMGKIKRAEGAQKVTDADVDSSERGGYSDAEVEEQYQAAKARSAYTPEQTVATQQPVHPEGYGLQEEAVKTTTYPQEAVTPVSPRVSEPAIREQPEAIPTQTPTIVEPQQTAINPLIPRAKWTQEALSHSFDTEQDAQSAAQWYSGQVGKTFFVHKTPEGAVLRLAPQSASEVPAETIRSVNKSLDQLLNRPEKVANEISPEQVRTVDDNSVQLLNRPEAEAGAEVKVEAGGDVQAPERANLVQRLNRPLIDERLGREYKTRLSAGRDLAALRKENPERTLGLVPRGEGFVIREQRVPVKESLPAGGTLQSGTRKLGQTNEVPQHTNYTEAEEKAEHKRVAVAMLAQAAYDYTKKNPAIRQDAEDWIAGKTKGPLSFQWAVETLGLDPEEMAKAIREKKANAEAMRDTIKLFSFDPVSLLNLVSSPNGEIKWSSSQDIMEDISKRFNDGKWFELDMAFSKGNWHGNRKEEVKHRFDKFQIEPGTTKADTSEHIPLPDNTVKSIAWDPPFIIRYSDDDKGIMSKRFTSFRNNTERLKTYVGGIREAARVLKPNGVMVLKTQSYFGDSRGWVLNNVGLAIRTAHENGLDLVGNYAIEPVTTKTLYAKSKKVSNRLPVQYLVFKKQVPSVDLNVVTKNLSPLWESIGHNFADLDPQAVVEKQGITLHTFGGSLMEGFDEMTGAFSSLFDRRQRVEIPDQDAMMTPAFSGIKEDNFFKPKIIRLDQALVHPELFQRYPGLRDVSVSSTPMLYDFKKEYQGWYNVRQNRINITPYAIDPFATLLHEIQHVIQFREKFAIGGSPKADVLSKHVPKILLDKFVRDIKLQTRGSMLARIGERNIAQEKLDRFGSFNQEEVSTFNNMILRNIEIQQALYDGDKQWRAGVRTELLNENPYGFGATKFYGQLSQEQYNNTMVIHEILAKYFPETSNRDRYEFLGKTWIENIQQFQKKVDEAEITIQAQKELLHLLDNGTEEEKQNIVLDQKAFELYKHIAGEVESRDVAARARMSDEERRATPPYSSQPQKLDEMIVLFSFDPLMFISDPKNLWQSKMANVFETDKVPKLIMKEDFPDIVKRLLKNNEFKKEEWEDISRLTGLEQEIAKWGDQPIPREVVADMIRQYGIHVDEVVYHEKQGDEETEDLADAMYDDLEDANTQLDIARLQMDSAIDRYNNSRPEERGITDFRQAESVDQLKPFYLAYKMAVEKVDRLRHLRRRLIYNQYETKHRQHTLGERREGSNYIELVLYSPESAEMPEDDLHFVEGVGRKQIGWFRGVEYTDGDGDLVFHIEEVQSKRHQEGKEKGYLERKRELNPAMKEIHARYVRDYGSDFVNWPLEVKATYHDEIEQARTKPIGIVPDAPFRQSHLRLLARRIVRWAAERGIRKISWTTGEQQAKRWSLRQVADTLTYAPISKTLTAYKNGEVVFAEEVQSKDRIVEMVGVDLAEQLLDETPKETWKLVEKSPPSRFIPFGRERTVSFHLTEEEASRTLERFRTRYPSLEVYMTKETPEDIERHINGTALGMYESALWQGSRDGLYTREEVEQYLKYAEDDPGFIPPEYIEKARRGEIGNNTVIIPDDLAFYSSKWPEKIYGFAGRMEAPFEGAPLKPIGGYETSVLGVALKEAVEPYKVKVDTVSSISKPTKVKSRIGKDGVYTPEELVGALNKPEVVKELIDVDELSVRSTLAMRNLLGALEEGTRFNSLDEMKKGNKFLKKRQFEEIGIYLADIGLNSLGVEIKSDEVKPDLEKFSVQPGIKLTQEQIDHFRSTPFYLYSVSPLDILKKGSEEFDKLPGGGGLTRLGTNYRRFLSIPRWAAKVSEDFGEFYHRNSQITRKWQGLKRASLESLDSWFKLSEEEQQSVVEKFKEIEGKKLKATPTSELSFTPVSEGRKVCKSNPQFYSELKTFLLSKGMTEPAANMLVAIRQSLNEDFVQHYNNLSRDNSVAASLLEDMEKHIGFVNNYLPHNWYGNHYIEGVDEKGEVKARIELQVGMFERALGKTRKFRKIKEALEQHPDYKGLKWGEVKDSSESERYYINSPVSVEVVGRVLDEAVSRLKKDPDLVGAVEAVQKALPKEVLEILQSRGFSNFAKRKGILGYEQEDLMRVITDYKVGLYDNLMRMEQAREFAKLMITKKPKKADFQMLTQYMQDQMAPHSQLDNAVNLVRQVLFMRYIAARAKPAFENLSNSIVTAMPTLGLYADGSTVAYMKATKDLTAQFAKESAQKIRKVGVFGRVDGNNVLSGEELAVLKQLQEDGTIQPQQVYEMADKLRQSYKQQARVIESVLGWGKAIGATPMEMTEWYSRASMALAAARLMADGKLTDSGMLKRYGLEKGSKIPITDSRVLDFTREVVLDAHGEYGTHNRPPIVRTGRLGKVLSIAYTFRHFQQNLGSLWWHMMKQGPRGIYSFSKSIAGQVFMAGLLRGIPLASLLMSLYRAFTGDDPEEALRKKLPGNADTKDVLLYGAGASGAFGLPKVSLGVSMEFSLPDTVVELISSALSGNSPQFNEGPMTEASGVAGSAVRDVVGGFNAWANGDKERALEYFSPIIVLRDILAANRLYTKGQYTLTGQPITEPGGLDPMKITKGEAIAKTFGFQPLKLDKSFRHKLSMDRQIQMRIAAQNKLVSRFANAFKDGDETEMGRVLDEIMAWNVLRGAEGKPELMIDPRAAIKARLQPNRGDRRFLGRSMDLWEEYQE